MLIAYDGTHYGGWQVQPNSTSIQSLIQNALQVVLRKPTDLTGSGRTDAGVHALGQVAHFCADEKIEAARLVLSLNAILPRDIRIKSIENVDSKFHSRFSATGKVYHYHLHLDRVMDPFKRAYCLHVLEKIDLALIRQAAELFIGEKDFTSFANEAYKGSAAKCAIRTLRRLDIIDEPSGVRIELEADGFLYKMARNIVGTLLDIGAGRTKLSEVPEIFAAKDRKKAGFTAPAQGLFLVQVFYG